MRRALRTDGLDKRLAYMMVLRADGDGDRTLLFLMASSAFLSMWISNTAAVAILHRWFWASPPNKDWGRVLLLWAWAWFRGQGHDDRHRLRAQRHLRRRLLSQEAEFTFLDWMTIRGPQRAWPCWSWPGSC